jgi:putative ABC transport system permease protein
VDPAFQPQEMRSLAAAFGELQGGLRLAALALGCSPAAFCCSPPRGCAMMSFAVAQRRREIGIRTALGARPGRILANVFSRAASQLGAGAARCLVIAVGLDAASAGDFTAGAGTLMMPVVATLMLVVGMLATLGPARRGLGVQPMEALREQ